MLPEIEDKFKMIEGALDRQCDLDDLRDIYLYISMHRQKVDAIIRYREENEKLIEENAKLKKQKNFLVKKYRNLYNLCEQYLNCPY
jgi:hypothetical protein